MAKRARAKLAPKRDKAKKAREAPERDPASSCPNCSGPVSLLDAFCPACGTQLDEEE